MQDRLFLAGILGCLLVGAACLPSPTAPAGSLVSSVEAAAREDPPPEDSRFGVDYVFPLDRRYRKEELARALARTGAGWLDFHEVSWARTEPRRPSRGKSRYRWEALDEAVRIYQREGFRLVFTLRLGNGWFKGPPKHEMAVPMPLGFLFERQTDQLPADGNLGHYQRWVRAMVERYDGDGLNDMPGLAAPVRHFQVGNEYANPMFWRGTPQDYGTLLAAAREAAREASPEVVIISNGIRWNDLFHDDPTGEQFEARYARFLERLPSDGWRTEFARARVITEETVRLAPLYDVLDAGGNGPYPTMSEGYMAWVKAELARNDLKTTLWDAEARTEPLLVMQALTQYHTELEIPGGREILDAMGARRDPRHERAVRWYRAEQARTLAQVFVTRFAAGFEKVFMGMALDWDHSLGAITVTNPYMGLLSREGKPWPALHAFRELTSALDGFQEARKEAIIDDVELYRFSFADGRGPVWVAWLREARPRGMGTALPSREVLLPQIDAASSVREIPTLSKESPEVPFSLSPGGLSVNLAPTPVLIRP